MRTGAAGAMRFEALPGAGALRTGLLALAFAAVALGAGHALPADGVESAGARFAVLASGIVTAAGHGGEGPNAGGEGPNFGGEGPNFTGTGLR